MNLNVKLILDSLGKVVKVIEVKDISIYVFAAENEKKKKLPWTL